MKLRILNISSALFCALIFSGCNSAEPPPEPSGERIPINSPALQDSDENFVPQDNVQVTNLVFDFEMENAPNDDQDIVERVQRVKK